MSWLTKSWFWILAGLLSWVALVIVQIALGMGTAPGDGGAP
jgi:energy-converting hydrogenase Eha subunit B